MLALKENILKYINMQILNNIKIFWVHDSTQIFENFFINGQM